MVDMINLYEENFQKILQSEEWKSWNKNNMNILYDYGATSVHLYSLYFDRVINFGIREGRLSELGYILLTRFLKLLDKAEPIPTDLILFRGVFDNPELKLHKLEKDDIFIDLGISSKSINPSIAFNETGNPCCFTMISYYKNDLPMIYLPKIAKISSKFKQYEFLTYPGEILQVKDKFTYSNNDGYADFSRDTIYFSFNGIKYSSLPNDILPIVDLTIDKDFRILINNIREKFKTFDSLGVTFEYFGSKDIAVITKVKTVYTTRYMNDPDTIIWLYTLFIRNKIIKLVFVNGYDNFPIFKAFSSVYQEGGTIISKISHYDEEFMKIVYSGNLISTDVNNNLNIQIADFSYKLSDIPDYWQPEKRSEDLEELMKEQDFNNYPSDIQTGLSSLYGGYDPVVRYSLNLVDENIKKYEHYIFDVDNISPYQLAEKFGMIIPNNVDPRKYYLTNIDEIFENQKHIDIVRKTNKYIPDNLYKFKEVNEGGDTEYYFIKYDRNVFKYINGALKIVTGEPVIGYGYGNSNTYYTLDEYTKLKLQNKLPNDFYDILPLIERELGLNVS